MYNGYTDSQENFNFGSDLACERGRADTSLNGVEFKKESVGDFVWERIRIFSDDGEKSIGRPRGIYNTLTTPRLDTLDDEQLEDGAEELAKEFCILCDRVLTEPKRILVVGLGNSRLTPDSIGPRTAELVNATMHIRNFDNGMFRELECSEIAVLSPGVTASSGMEATDAIIGVCDRIEPDIIFAIDALASKSPMRLGRTIQISDTGIFPGSGIGNHRKAINQKTIGVPVIAIGVPTVINAETFLLGDEPPERRELLRARFRRKESEGMFVSPREIDGIVNSSAQLISMGINQAFGIL